MALSAAIAAGLLLAALGLVAARSAPLGARWLAFVVAVGFAVTALVADRTELRDLPARRQRAELQGDVAARRTAALRAAAQAGPRVDELELRWRVGEASAAPRAALGAVTSRGRSEAPAVASVNLPRQGRTTGRRKTRQARRGGMPTGPRLP